MTTTSPMGLFAIDGLISNEERDIQKTVAAYLDSKVRPQITSWFETGTIPARELARDLGGLGLLGMHLKGYGCAGTSATAYGFACRA